VDSPRSLLGLPVFLLSLVVRGLPALLLYRSEPDMRGRQALALLSATQLPLVVAITAIGVEGGHMSAETAAPSSAPACSRC
jgi:hypothetical protein